MFKKGYRFIKTQTRWWTLIVAIIEMNIADLIFVSALQSLSLGSNNFLDKLNSSFMFLVSFIVVFYAFGFYAVIYSNEKKKCSKGLLIYSKQRIKSYFFEPLLFLARGAIKSFVHGYFIYSYPTQIMVLLFVDVLFLCVCFLMRKTFRNCCIFLLVTLYFFGFLLFDLYFVLECHTSLTK